MGLSGAMFPGVRSVNSLIQVSKGSQKTGAQKSRHVANGPSAMPRNPNVTDLVSGAQMPLLTGVPAKFLQNFPWCS